MPYGPTLGLLDYMRSLIAPRPRLTLGQVSGHRPLMPAENIQAMQAAQSPQRIGPFNDPRSISGQLGDVGHTIMQLTGAQPFGLENPADYQTQDFAKLGPVPEGMARFQTMPRPSTQQGMAIPFTAKTGQELHELINARNVLHHSSDLMAGEMILRDQKILPRGNQGGRIGEPTIAQKEVGFQNRAVSLSRAMRVADPITFEVDPRYVIKPKPVQGLSQERKQLGQFEFETATEHPIPIDGVKVILINRPRADTMYGTEESAARIARIRALAKEQNIPVIEGTEKELLQRRLIGSYSSREKTSMQPSPEDEYGKLTTDQLRKTYFKNPQTFYRLHWQDAPPFNAENASTAPWGEDVVERLRGYSAVKSPEELMAYFKSRGGLPDDTSGHAMIFRGFEVGIGPDGEPLVIPKTFPRPRRLTISEFEKAVKNSPKR